MLHYLICCSVYFSFIYLQFFIRPLDIDLFWGQGARLYILCLEHFFTFWCSSQIYLVYFLYQSQNQLLLFTFMENVIRILLEKNRSVYYYSVNSKVKIYVYILTYLLTHNCKYLCLHCVYITLCESILMSPPLIHHHTDNFSLFSFISPSLDYITIYKLSLWKTSFHSPLFNLTFISNIQIQYQNY